MNKFKHACIISFSILILNGCSAAQNDTNALKNSIYQPLSDYEGNIAQASVAGSLSQESAPLPTTTSIPQSDLINTTPQAKTVLSQFSTNFKNAAQSRSKNINRASVAIDNQIIEPGESFSFNDTVGPTTKKNGFKLGRIFVNGKDSKGYGGGVCQVSSTLYNAVEQAGLEVTERHPHSKHVGYVDEGKDAATSYGVIDFKFINNKLYPVKINSYIEGEKIVVSIESV